MDHDENPIITWAICGVVDLIAIVALRIFVIQEPISLLYYLFAFILGPIGLVFFWVFGMGWLFHTLLGITL